MSHMQKEEPGSLDERRKAILEALGLHIRERREAQGLTVSGLGSRFADVGARTRWFDYKGVWALESGRASVGLEDLQVIADAFGDPIDAYVAHLLPAGLAISPDEAHERARLAYREFLDRAARRVEEAVSKTMDDAEFRQTVGWLAELPPRRREMVREVVRGLRRNEQEDRFVRAPAGAPLPQPQVAEPIDPEAQLAKEDLERAVSVGEARARLMAVDPQYQEFARWQSGQRTKTSKGGSRKR